MSSFVTICGWKIVTSERLYQLACGDCRRQGLRYKVVGAVDLSHGEYKGRGIMQVLKTAMLSGVSALARCTPYMAYTYCMHVVMPSIFTLIDHAHVHKIYQHPVLVCSRAKWVLNRNVSIIVWSNTMWLCCAHVQGWLKIWTSSMLTNILQYQYLFVGNVEGPNGNESWITMCLSLPDSNDRLTSNTMHMLTVLWDNLPANLGTSTVIFRSVVHL